MQSSKKRSRFFERMELPLDVRNDLAMEADAADMLELQAAMMARSAREELEAAAGEAKKQQESSPTKAPLLDGRGPLVPLFASGAVDAAQQKVANVGVGDKAWQTQRVKLIAHVAARGPVRRLHRRRDWKKALHALREHHANFNPVLDLIEGEFCLAGERQPIVLPPMLLNGPPGCGKTYFAQHLADFFQTGFVRVSMETAQTAAELTGTAAHWSNTKPGRLFDQLVDGDYANPVFLLDEVDKAGGYESHRSDKALYALLERKSAGQWSDTSMPELVMDASHVVWLLTSNDARHVPAPLLSRMHQFDIEPLGADESCALVRRLYREEVRRYRHLKLDPELPIAHCEALRCHSPRLIARLVHRLVARLAKHGRKQVLPEDLKAIGAPLNPNVVSMGFSTVRPR